MSCLLAVLSLHALTARPPPPAHRFCATEAMAELIAMRVHADARLNTAVVACHPGSILCLDPTNGLEHVLHMRTVRMGEANRVLTFDDVAETVRRYESVLACIVVDVPQIQNGCACPSWEHLRAIVKLAAEKNIPIHVSGARLWEAQTYFGVDYVDLAAGYDSIMVGFKASLGAMGGAMLVGSSLFIAQARAWRQRLGGTLSTHLPFAVSAQGAFNTQLGMFGPRAAKLKSIIALMTRYFVVTGWPMRFDPPDPHGCTVHVYLRGKFNFIERARNSVLSTNRILLFKELQRAPRWKVAEDVDVASIPPADVLQDASEVILMPSTQAAMPAMFTMGAAGMGSVGMGMPPYMAAEHGAMAEHGAGMMAPANITLQPVALQGAVPARAAPVPVQEQVASASLPGGAGADANATERSSRSSEAVAQTQGGVWAAGAGSGAQAGHGAVPGAPSTCSAAAPVVRPSASEFYFEWSIGPANVSLHENWFIYGWQRFWAAYTQLIRENQPFPQIGAGALPAAAAGRVAGTSPWPHLNGAADGGHPMPGCITAAAASAGHLDGMPRPTDAAVGVGAAHESHSGSPNEASEESEAAPGRKRAAARGKAAAKPAARRRASPAKPAAGAKVTTGRKRRARGPPAQSVDGDAAQDESAQQAASDADGKPVRRSGRKRATRARE